MTDVTASDIMGAPPAPAPVPNLHVDPATAWAPAKSIHEQADTLRSQLIGNPEFRQKHFSGDVSARRQLAALDSIKISSPDGDPAALRALADMAGIVEMPRPVAAPEGNPLAAAVAPKPEMYTPHWGPLRTELAPAEFDATVKAWTGWAAGMGFSANLGKAVLEHMVDLGRRVGSMSPEARESFAIEQESRGMMAEGPDAYRAMKADAHKALQRAGAGNPVSKFLKEGAFLDHWTLGTLARYHRSYQRQ